MKSFRVATFANSNVNRATTYNAYTRDYNEQWSGCKMYTVIARNGTEAKKIAIGLRKAEHESEQREGYSK